MGDMPLTFVTVPVLDVLVFANAIAPYTVFALDESEELPSTAAAAPLASYALLSDRQRTSGHEWRCQCHLP